MERYADCSALAAALPNPQLAKELSERELNSIRSDAAKVKILRERLSDISWWMRLLCQRVAQRANREDEETGKFFEARYRSGRLLNEGSILACAAYVDLNPIRAALAETLEESEYTSVQRRIQSLCSKSRPSRRKRHRPMILRRNDAQSRYLDH